MEYPIEPLAKRRRQGRDASGGLTDRGTRAASGCTLEFIARKTPCRDGTTHIIVKPLDSIVRLVALVSKPRVNLTSFQRVFAPHRAVVR